MKLGIASDHAGFEIRKRLVELLSKEYNVIDFGCYSEESCDYPDYALKVASAVQKKEINAGILLCATGIGMCITANKIKGVRAALCFSEDTIRYSREHNSANILCLPARVSLCGTPVTVEKLYNFIKLWLECEPSNEERHKKRVKKIELIENENFK